MSLYLDTKLKGYNAQRAASQGASITLVARCGEYSALFECAKRCKEILGDKGYSNLGELDALESIPCFSIPLQEIQTALQKLSARYSVALMEYSFDVNNSDVQRFFLIWRITNNHAAPEVTKPVITLDDF